MQEAEVLPEPLQKKLVDPGESIDVQPSLTWAIRAIKIRDERLYSRLVEEISYLSNVLIAGCSYAGRRFRPAEALEAALAVCNIGSEHILGIDFGDQKIQQVKRVESFLADQDLIKFFKVGWKILHTDVLVYAARALQNTLSRIGRRIKERRQTRKLTHLVSALEAQVTAGRPWLLRPELDHLDDFLDSKTMMVLRTLFNEYPTMPTGISEHEQTWKPPFISTIRQIHAIQRFLENQGVANPENDRDLIN